MNDLIAYGSAILISAVLVLILITMSKRIKLSCVIAPILIETLILLYNFFNYGVISQFGFLPYVFDLPFLLVGSLLGGVLWVRFFKKSPKDN